VIFAKPVSQPPSDRPTSSKKVRDGWMGCYRPRSVFALTLFEEARTRGGLDRSVD